MQNENEVEKPVDATDKKDYEAPAIESVLSAEELTREVNYAGVIGPSQQLG